MYNNLVFGDVEVAGPNHIGVGKLTEFALVHFETGESFYARLYETRPSTDSRYLFETVGEPYDHVSVFRQCEEWIQRWVKGRPSFISDNPSFDFMWLNQGFFDALGYNPLGFSARRIGDFYAGLTGDFRKASDWKVLRTTNHTHNPVDDVVGNVGAFRRILNGERVKR